MPYVNLRVVGKLTPEQKKQIAKEFSDTLLRVAKKPKEATYLVIDEAGNTKTINSTAELKEYYGERDIAWPYDS